MSIMRTAAPSEGQDNDTLLLISAAFLGALAIAALTSALPWQPALAQGSPPCTAIEDDTERLACYDRALRAAQTPAAPVAPAPVGQSSAGQTPAAQSVPAASATAPASTSTSPAPAAPRGERRIRESAAPVAPAAPAAGSSANDDNEDRAIPIVIIGMRAHPGRETHFTAEDGSQWVQIDSQRVVGLPEPPFAAEIKPGTMGSQFLVPKDRGRAIRVRAAEQ